MTNAAAFVALRGMMKRHFTWLLLPFCLVTFTTAARADLQLPALFSDNMVLQRNVSVPIWGWADDGEVITVRFRGREVKTTAHNGAWSLKLRRQRAGGPDTLTITSGARSFQFTNVLVGEVWVASGQSNMEFPLSRSVESQAAIASATNALIHLFMVPNVKSEAPTVHINSSWKVCSPDLIGGYSARW